MGLVAAVPGCLAKPDGAYAEPDFEKKLFAREALLLETQEVASVVTALTAIAANFPNAQQVDNELRAKALAIALRLDGTHPAAVATNADLRGGDFPEPLGDFATLDEIAQQLWTTAGYLQSTEKGKDERVLQFCLVEIAREIDPTNLADSNLYPTRLPKRDFPGWSSILRKGSAPAFEFPNPAGDPDKAADPDPAPGTGSAPAPGVPRTAQGSVRSIVADGEGPALATITGDLKTGGGTAPLAVVFADVEGQTSQPLNRYRDTLVSALTELEKTWPRDGGVLVLTVRSAVADDQALLLSSAILADSLIRISELDPRVVALGFVAPEGSLMAVDKLYQRLHSLTGTDAEIVIVPEENLPELRDMLLLGEILVASTLKEAATMAAAARDGIFEGSLTDFQLIQEVVRDNLATGGDIVQMTGYNSITKKLKEVATPNPRHASASLLLEHGAGELPKYLTLGGSLAALYRATGPVVAAIQEQGSADPTTAAAALEAVTRIQPLLNLETNALSTMMTGILKDIRSYAGVASKTSDPATTLRAKISSDWEKVRAEFSRLKNRDEG